MRVPCAPCGEISSRTPPTLPCNSCTRKHLSLIEPALWTRCNSRRASCTCTFGRRLNFPVKNGFVVFSCEDVLHALLTRLVRQNERLYVTRYHSSVYNVMRTRCHTINNAVTNFVCYKKKWLHAENCVQMKMSSCSAFGTSANCDETSTELALINETPPTDLVGNNETVIITRRDMQNLLESWDNVKKPNTLNAKAWPDFSTTFMRAWLRIKLNLRGCNGKAYRQVYAASYNKLRKMYIEVTNCKTNSCHEKNFV